MKATDNFTKSIKEYITNLAKSNSTISHIISNREKNIDDCIFTNESNILFYNSMNSFVFVQNCT